MAAEQRPVVDDLGNIAVHGRSGLVLVVKIETATAGVYEDISASDLFFEIGGKLRLALSAGADIYSRQVILTRAQIATLSINQPYAFAIHDETPSTPSTLWTGTITTFGFKAAPTGVPDVDGEAANWTGATVVIQPGGGSPVVVVNYMGQPGSAGAAGVGIPTGGTTGQYLRKSSSTDYATGWDTLTADDVSGLSSTLSTLTSADVSLTTRLSTEETTRASADTSLATAAAATYLPLAGGVMTGALAAVAGTAALPGLAVAGDLDTGIYGVSANVLGVSAGGGVVQTWGVGTSTLTGNLSVGVAGAHSTDYGITINNGSYNGSDSFISFKNGAAATELARINMNQDGLLNIGTVNAFAFEFKTTNTNRWQISATGHFLAAADNTYDIGASGASRPRNGFFGGTLTIGSHITMGTGSQISCAGAATLTSSTDGIWRMANNAGTDFGRLQFGGTTSAFPAWKRSGTVLQARLADDSNYAPVRASYYAFSGGQLIDSNSTDQFIFQNNGATALAYLAVEANNTLALRNGVNAQTLRVYNTYTDGSNYERGTFAWSANVLTISAESAGTGGNRGISIVGKGQVIVESTLASVLFRTSGNIRWLVDASGHFTTIVDNTLDIGASGANRPRIAYIGTRVVAPTVTTTATTVASLPAAATAGAGGRAFVTDATATTYLSIVAGGGANAVPVVSNGTNWLIG